MSLQLTEISSDEVKKLAADYENASLLEILGYLWKRFGKRAAIGTSFQGAGLVMIDHAVRAGFGFPVFTLDTDVLFPETYALKERLEKHWGIAIEAVRPKVSLKEQEMENGPELWRTAPDACCTIRKVEPLKRKFGEIAVWITGLRRQQSETRENTRVFELYEFDELREQHILKANPMAGWPREAVWEYIHQQGIPYNPLHDRGYRSIGCTHCTRPTGDGENERAGRWTGFDKTECGIHTFLGASI